VRANWVGGSSAHKEFARPPLQKNPPSGKSSAFEFLNLHLEKRIVQETAPFPYAALRAARSDDVVLISGKGTDPFIMGPKGSKEPWSDAVVVREELERLLSEV